MYIHANNEMSYQNLNRGNIYYEPTIRCWLVRVRVREGSLNKKGKGKGNLGVGVKALAGLGSRGDTQGLVGGGEEVRCQTKDGGDWAGYHRRLVWLTGAGLIIRVWCRDTQGEGKVTGVRGLTIGGAVMAGTGRDAAKRGTLPSCGTVSWTVICQLTTNHRVTVTYENCDGDLQKTSR